MKSTLRERTANTRRLHKNMLKTRKLETQRKRFDPESMHLTDHEVQSIVRSITQ